MTRRLRVFLVFTILCLGTQLAWYSDPPPSVSLREQEREQKQEQGHAPPAPPEPHNPELKRYEAKRRDIRPDGPVENIPQGLEVLVEQVGPSPLPYQWVRLRVIFHNKGKESITDTRLLTPTIIFAGLKGPKDEALRRPGAATYTLGPPQPSKSGLTFPLTGVGKMMREERLTLQPGEKISITSALGSWQAGDGVFDQPGDYQLQLQYAGKDYLLSAKPITVTVGAPQGTDAGALRLLQKLNASLAGFTATVRYDNVWVGENSVACYKELTENHPKSSYADYARYLLTCRSGSEKSRVYTFEEAIELRASIDYKTFSFGADVLLRIRRGTQDRARIETIDEKLDADFYDTDVWIENQAERLPFTQLMELRKRPAERKQPQPAKP